MPGQSYITVDGSLAESITEYASILDLYNENTNYVEKLAAYAITPEGDEDDEDVEIEFKDQVFQEIADSYPHLAAIPDRDFESVGNLVVFIFTFSNEFELYLKQFLTNLIQVLGLQDVDVKVNKNKKKTLKITAIISVLSNVFNLIELENFEFRNFNLKLILNLVEILDNGSILLPIVSNVEGWLLSDIDSKPLEVQEETRLLILQLAKLISSSNELESLKLFELAITKIPNVSSNLINQYLIENLNSLKALDLSKILELEVVIKNHQESQEYLKLLQNYLSLTTLEFESSLSQFTSLTSINFKTLLKKNQFLTLSKIALTTNSITYTTIASSLNLSANDVELFIFDAIKSGVVEGKLSQINQTFQVYKVNLIVKSIELKDWLEIKGKLLEWRSKLKDVRALVDQASKKKAVKA